jgi:hypothetical protein
MSALRQPAAASALEQAETALAAAQDAHERARLASMDATADAAALRASVKAGGSKVTPADLVEADAAAEHAALSLQGAAAEIPALSAAVAAARADEAADEVVTELPRLGLDVAVSLAALEEALAPVVSACKAYDAYIETATSHLGAVARPPADPVIAPPNPLTRGGTSESPFTGAGSEPATVAPEIPASGRPRVSFPRYGHPRVDTFDLTSCRGPGQLAAVLLPAFRALGANESLIEGLRILAAGAPTLPGA